VKVRAEKLADLLKISIEDCAVEEITHQGLPDKMLSLTSFKGTSSSTITKGNAGKVT